MTQKELEGAVADVKDTINTTVIIQMILQFGLKNGLEDMFTLFLVLQLIA